MEKKRIQRLSFVLVIVSCLVMCGCSGQWKAHEIQQLNGSAERIKLPGKFQILTENWTGRWTQQWNRVAAVPYIAYAPEKDRVLMLVSCGNPHQAMILTSDDHGATWSEPWYVHTDENGNGDTGMGVGLAYLGEGKALLRAGGRRWFSDDYGQTWGQSVPLPPGPGGAWDPPMVETDLQSGKVTRLWETIYDGDHSRDPYSQAFVRESLDKGKTWSKWVKVPQWAGANEVNLIRARNGDIVAAHRTNMPEKFVIRDPKTGAEISALDHYEGLGVSISKDNGKTWSKITKLFDWGRHHSSMVVLPNGDIVMTYAARKGYTNTPEGYPQFGVEAIISHDNGKTWDLDHKYILAAWAGNRTDPGWSWARSPQSTSSVLLPDGSILTAFGTGYRAIVPKPKKDEQKFNPRDVGLVKWRVNNEGLNDDTTIADAPFDSALRNWFDPKWNTFE